MTSIKVGGARCFVRDIDNDPKMIQNFLTNTDSSAIPKFVPPAETKYEPIDQTKFKPDDVEFVDPPASPVRVDHPDGANFLNLIDWLDKCGAYYKKLKLTYFSEDYRGVLACHDIDKGEVVFFLPQSKILTYTVAKNTPIG